MKKQNKFWVAWNYKSRADEIVELVINEINDMIKKNKIKIDYDFINNHDWDYKLKLKLKLKGE